MRIDEIETGAEYTDDRTHFARDVRPRRYRADAVETIPGTNRRAVRVTEIDPESGAPMPEGSTITRRRGDREYTEVTRSGAYMLARDLEPYGRARANWEAYRAAYTEVADLAQALRSHLVDPAELPAATAAEILPRVYGPGTASGRGHEGRLDLTLSPEVGRRLVAALERLERLGWDIGQEVETGHRQADVTEGDEIVGALGRSFDDLGIVAEVDHLAEGSDSGYPCRHVTIDVSFDEARRLIDVLEDRTRE